MKIMSVFLIAGYLYAQKPTILDAGFQPFDSNPYLTVTSSPTASVNINWNTLKPAETIVAYGSSLLEDTARITGVRNYHHMRLSGLSPATWYYYKVLPHGDIRTFKTFPLYADSFDFIVFGDTRTDSATHQSIIDKILEYAPPLVIHTGDLVTSGGSGSDWRTFFNTEDALLQGTYFIPVVGNHEKPYWPYDTFFALPDAEYFYSVDYGSMHIICLDTEMDLNGLQRDWLINDLVSTKEDTSIKWIFVNSHRPPYSSGSHGSQMDVRNAWCKIFEDYRVDIVFNGHDHIYERTYPINGVVYMVIGGGGAPLYDVDKHDWTAYSEKVYHFCHIKIAGKRLSLKTMKPDGTVIDSSYIEK